MINGSLYRVAPAYSTGSEENLLVVPAEYRNQLLRIAHDAQCSGHTGVRKTEQRLKALFYWPKMQAMVRKYVRSCKPCQLVAARKRNERAPLQQVDVMATHAFGDITLDIMGGQLPVSANGNKYLLLIICNASKWLHGIPLRNLRAETIAEKLLQFFCQYGIPKTLRCDNYSTFHSELITKVRERLGIDARFSSPFHFQSHGSIERAHQTVENVLRKFIEENPKIWDKSLPMWLFALNTSVHSSTGYSPAQLVFGRDLRGLLHVARENWAGDGTETPENMPTIRYMEQLSQRIDSALNVARQNVAAAQQKMKENFDKTSSVRDFAPGETVLILLPTSSNKLMAKWKGPAKVLRRCENNNYEIQIGRRKTILHVNSLRRFYEPETSDDDPRDATAMMIVTEDADSDILCMDDGDQPLSSQQAGSSGDATTADFVIGNQLTADQGADMRRLLADFDDVFTDRPGRTDLIQHHIRVTDEMPTYQAPYRIPESLRDAVYEELMKMLDNNIIRYDPNTLWNSPLIVVRKPDGNIRLVNNFIKLNAKTVDEPYQMTRTDELLSRVAGARYLTKLDLKQAYFQIDLTPESRKYTGFYTPFGSFSYVSTPMGLKSASSTCQRLMDRILRGAHKYAGTLLDDILIFDKDFPNHLNHVRDVLQRLRDAGLTANAKKCSFACPTIKVLGHIVDNGTIRPDDDKIKVIKAWKLPTNKKQLKSFLGLTGYFRHFLEHYATKTFPLTEMLARNKPDKLVWGEAELEAFNKLKLALMTKPVLRPPDMSKDFKIFADASSVALSGILVQKEDDSPSYYVIAYASRKLLPRERKFAIVELELMAIVFSLTKFHHWVYGKKIEVFSDHRPLQWLDSLSKHSSRLARWNLIIQNYNVTTTYIAGGKQVADFLTRLE